MSLRLYLWCHRRHSNQESVSSVAVGPSVGTPPADQTAPRRTWPLSGPCFPPGLVYRGYHTGSPCEGNLQNNNWFSDNNNVSCEKLLKNMGIQARVYTWRLNNNIRLHSCAIAYKLGSILLSLWIRHIGNYCCINWHRVQDWATQVHVVSYNFVPRPIPSFQCLLTGEGRGYYSHWMDST